MQNLYFPFSEIRPIQKELVKDVQQAIEKRRCLIAHAPTGLGKTAATLGPALTSALNDGYSVFFLTPKHTQHQIAVETLQKIKERHNLNFGVADLIGKKWMCPVPAIEKLSSKEFNEYCRTLRAEERCFFFNKVWGKKSQLLQKADELLLDLKTQSPLHAEEVIEHCRNCEMCAYEISCLLAKEAKVIIADYFHLFHPSVRQALLMRTKKEIENSIIIIDEAHNLPARVREILSSRLSTIILKRASREAKVFRFNEIARALKYMSDGLENLSGEEMEIFVDKERFMEEVENSTGTKYDELLGDLDSAGMEIRKSEKKSFVGSVADFLNAWVGDDAGFARILRKGKTRSGVDFISLSYNCLSPAISSSEAVKNSVSTILMSGTLIPGEMYRDLLGFDKFKTDIKVYPSPFTQQNRLTLINPAITTKFTERNEEEFRKTAKECLDVIREIPHNCAIFFPSYVMLQNVLPFFEGIKKRVFVDKPDLNKTQRVEILRDFRNSAEESAVLLAVQGGSFAEGIDLPGKFLECVVVVGVPLASPDLSTKALIEYYNLKFKRGWDYGYIYPAMTRAIQSAGRVVRSQQDRGVVVFLDKRFTWENYLKCIPPEWKPVATRLAADKIRKFFEKCQLEI